jgi:hypothetical protein
MKILKIIGIVFIIYFVRRFILLYKAMKKIQQTQAEKEQFEKTQNTKSSADKVVEADFKVVD